MVWTGFEPGRPLKILYISCVRSKFCIQIPSIRAKKERAFSGQNQTGSKIRLTSHFWFVRSPFQSKKKLTETTGQKNLPKLAQNSG